MYTELPEVKATTAAERLTALQDARDVIAGAPSSGGFAAAMFGEGGKKGVGDLPGGVDQLIRLAEYITTGHDYKDTHPTGRRFKEVLELQRFDAEQHDRHHHLEAHAIPVPRHIAEKLLSGEFDPREVINLLREWHENPQPKDDDTTDESTN
ncbi:hypothetical protein SEA_RIZWANA_54 [Arthrobacter phage Rizwana]|nr:hypothetical protein SEA_RIZWANA_54 [Arthrobacter phage Rizwana]